jgi:DNA-binding XRE family transcriptional regulator
MDERWRRRIAAAGWKTGTVREFLGLSEVEARMIDLHLALADAIRPLRLKVGLTQAELASRLGSSQSRVAKMEAGDPTVSLDLLIKAHLALGTAVADITRRLLRTQRRRARARRARV